MTKSQIPNGLGTCKRVDVDEIWGFIGKKKKNARALEAVAGIAVLEISPVDSALKAVQVQLVKDIRGRK